MLERRKHVRIVENRPVTITQGKSMKGKGKIVDLSIRGLRFSADMKLKLGQKVQAGFSVGGKFDLNIAAVIRHGKRWKEGKRIYGLEFFIRDFKDLGQHIKLSRFIAEERRKQDQMLQKKISEEKNL